MTETLFDYAATQGASRRNGPATSRDAGRSVSGHVLRDQQALVLEAVVCCDRGANAHEVQTWLRDHGRSCPERNAIGSRFRELREMGLVRQVGDREGATGRKGHVHVATERGVEWVRLIVAERGEVAR